MSKLILNNQVVKPLFIGVFIINPILGVISLIMVLFSNTNVDKRKLLNLFCVFLGLFLAFINSTKIPQSDLYFHGENYLMAGKLLFWEYLVYNGKEPAYFTFNYIFYTLSGGSIKFWIITFSFFSYYLFFKAIIKFHLKLKATNNQLIFALVLAAFFPQLFSLSAHLIRQFIAGAIFIYFGVDKIFYNNNKWWLVLVAILTHSSSILLFAFIYFRFLGNFKNYKVINMVLIVVLISYQSISKWFLTLYGNKDDMIAYVLKRASMDTKFDLGGFQLLNYVMMVLMIAIVFYYKSHFKRIVSVYISDNPETNELSILKRNISFFFSVMILLCFFILININQSELSNRLFFYLFFYLPFILPLLTSRFKNSRLFNFLFSILFVSFFAYRLAFGTWEYASMFEIITNSSFAYLLRLDPIL